ncbi:MAG TPA: aldo/keto reductase family protein [Candidatus Elarobacter sp.]|jgi:voltage-dependent potassium channel beta subunit|nr:aldo/keto reductase family protein [Candidatus Elarobacter sp.]
MRYRNLGRWGVKVSAVGLGSWLTFGGSVEEDAARACMLRAYERGVTFFDTADVYARGRAEEVVGRTLRELPRAQIVLATKVYFPIGDGPNDRGLSRKHVREEIDASLRRLQTEYVDLYQCHRYDVTTPLEETVEAMNDLVRAGKVLYWGVSEWSADQIAAAVNLARARGWAEPVSNQPQYSALWRRVERRVFPVCRQYGLGNVVWSPLAMGILTGKYTDAANPPHGTRAAGRAKDMMEDYFTQPVLDAVQQLRPLAQRAGCTLAQLALAWCLRTDAVSSVIVGATRPEQVDDNVAAADLDVDPAIFAEMDRILATVAPPEPQAE